MKNRTQQMSERALAELARIQAPVREEDDGEVEIADLFEPEDENKEVDELVEERVQQMRAADEEYAWTLKELRRAFGRTQSDLAKRIGSTQSYVSQMERTGGDMLVSTLLAYLDGIGISPHLLVRLPESGRTVEVDLGAVLSGRYAAERPDEGREA